ncbi:SDR family oxidoreductase [Larkinella harenae]
MTTSIAPSILITGATGTVGTQVAQQLAGRGIPFRALVRSREKATQWATLPGVQLVTGDLSDPESVRAALEGIERAFLLTNSSEQAEQLQINFVELARQVGVKHLVKLSQLAADPHSPVRFLRYHAVVEQAIRQSGLTYTFLRPNLFMQGLIGFRDSIVKQGAFFATAGKAAVSIIDSRDIAAVAVEALLNSEHEGKVYDLTGPEALTHPQIAELLSEGLGRSVAYIDVQPAAMRQGLLAAGFPTWQTDGLLEDYAHYARGEASAVSSVVQDVLGRKPRGFQSFVKEYASEFAGLSA